MGNGQELNIRKNSVKEIPGMLTGPMMSLLVRLALPMAAGMFFQMVHNVVDAVFISLIDKSDPSYLGAMGIISPLIFLGMAIGNGLMIGTSSMAARAIGSSNHKVLDKTADSGIVIALLIGLITITALYLFDPRLINLLGAEGDYALPGLEYLRFIAPCMGIMLIGNVFFGILQGEGHMKLLMWAMIIGTVGNIILDPIFIFLLDMKVQGAALATVIAQAGSILFVITLFAGKTRIPLNWKRENVSRGVIKEIALIGFPQALSMMVRFLAFLIRRGVNSPPLGAKREYAIIERWMSISINHIIRPC